MICPRAVRVIPSSLVALLLLLPACVQVEQTLSLEQDGGGTLTVQYSMTLETLKEIEARARAEAEALGEEAPMPLDFDEAQIREDFKEYEPLGVRMEEATSWEDGVRRTVRLKMRFDSLGALSQTEFLSDRRLRVRRVDGGAMEFTQSAPPSDPMMAEMADLMREMMAGFRAELRVETPTDILDSNADVQEARVARWIFDVSNDPTALARAQRLDLRVTFAAGEPPMPEFPPK
jgi:hypothetical protein